MCHTPMFPGKYGHCRPMPGWENRHRDRRSQESSSCGKPVGRVRADRRTARRRPGGPRHRAPVHLRRAAPAQHGCRRHAAGAGHGAERTGPGLHRPHRGRRRRPARRHGRGCHAGPGRAGRPAAPAGTDRRGVRSPFRAGRRSGCGRAAGLRRRDRRAARARSGSPGHCARADGVGGPRAAARRRPGVHPVHVGLDRHAQRGRGHRRQLPRVPGRRGLLGHLKPGRRLGLLARVHLRHLHVGDLAAAHSRRTALRVPEGGSDRRRADLLAARRRGDEAYLEAHPKGQFGKHSYHLDELGLDGAALSERFADYIKRHDVARETF